MIDDSSARYVVLFKRDDQPITLTFHEDLSEAASLYDRLSYQWTGALLLQIVHDSNREEQRQPVPLQRELSGQNRILRSEVKRLQSIVERLTGHGDQMISCPLCADLSGDE